MTETKGPSSSALPVEGEMQNDVEVLLCMRLNDKDFFMPGCPPEERLRWAIPMAALMRVKPPYTKDSSSPSPAPLGDQRLASPNGACHSCGRAVTGERRLCGPCLARRPS